MPVLELQTACHPEDLFDVERPAALDADRQWWVVYTRSRQEKSLARELCARDVPFYLPLIPQTVVYPRSRVTMHLPLFGGYVFFFGSAEERVQCLKTNRVSRMIPVPDGRRLVRDLRQIRQAIASGAPLSVEDRLIPGQLVRVGHGPFAGFDGTIVKRQGATLLFIAVDFIQKGITLEIDSCLVRPL